MAPWYEFRQVFLMLGMWTFFGSALYIMASSIRRKQRNAMQQHVLDKFSSAKDFADFVQSPAGQKYVMSFTDAATSSHGAVLNSLRTGVVLLFAGIGFAFINFGDTSYLFLRIGTVLSFVGIGFLISAGISFWLARKLQSEAKE